MRAFFVRSCCTFYPWPKRHFPHQHAIKFKGNRKTRSDKQEPTLTPPTEKHTLTDAKIAGASCDSAQKLACELSSKTHGWILGG